MDSSTRQLLLDHITSDSDLESMEKESTLRFAKDSDHIDAFTAMRGWMTGFVKNDMVKVTSLTVKNDGKYHSTGVDDFEEGEGEIVGIQGEIPMGSLTIKNTERSSAAPSSMISTGTVTEDTFK